MGNVIDDQPRGDERGADEAGDQAFPDLPRQEGTATHVAILGEGIRREAKAFLPIPRGRFVQKGLRRRNNWPVKSSQGERTASGEAVGNRLALYPRDRRSSRHSTGK